jgi:hypothetical protein
VGTLVAVVCGAALAFVARPVTHTLAATPCFGAKRLVAVSTSDQLGRALARAQPGDGIRLAPGHYGGQFSLARSGTAATPIVVCGPASAVLDGGTLQHGYVLHLLNSSHTVVRGISVRNGAKGIVTDRWEHGEIIGVTVTHIGQEGIHLRTFSSDDRVLDSSVSHTGLSSAADSVHSGEGIYIGSAWENWKRYTGGRPDRCDRDVIARNTISHTTAESIDVKEGTTGGVISDNHFDGTGMQDPAGADSWLDVKGNDWRITGNTGVHSPADGFQVHVKRPGWGRGNFFSGNIVVLDHSGYAFLLSGDATQNTVGCSNNVRGGGTLTNVDSRCAGATTSTSGVPQQSGNNHSKGAKPGTIAIVAIAALVIMLSTIGWFSRFRRRRA